MEDSLKLESPNGRHSISLICTNDGPGIWLENKVTRTMISIYALNHQNGIGIYGDVNKSAMNIGLGVDNDGNPTIQLINKDGKFFNLTFDELSKLKEGK